MKPRHVPPACESRCIDEPRPSGSGDWLKHRSLTALIIVSAALLAGCESAPDDLRPWLRRDAGEWRLSDSGSIHRQGTLAGALPEGTAIAAGAGAEDYVRAALRDNPSIRSAQAKVRKMEARVPQVTSLEDPMLEVSPLGEMDESVAGMVGLMMGFSQQLPFPGKLEARGRIATQETRIAEQELAQVRLNVAAETRGAYWSYYFATRAIAVTQQSRDLLTRFRSVAETRYQTNLATQSDVLRAVVELGSLDSELATLEQQRATAAAMLNNLMDRPIDAPLPEPPEAQALPSAPPLDELLSLAARANPELAIIDRRLQAERQRLKLAKLQRWPDLTVGVTYNLVDDMGLSPIANGKDQWGVGFSLNVPIWFDKLRAAEREAYAGMHEQIADLTAARNRVAYAVREALLKAQTQQRLVKLFRDTIIPQARQAVQASDAGYQAGSVDFLALNDAWRKLLDYQVLYHQSVAELQKAYAQLQQAVGGDLPRPVAPTTQATVPMTDENRP